MVLIAHKRIRIVAGRIEEGPLQYSGGYSKAQGWTDIRIVELPPVAVRAARYIYSKGGNVPSIAAKQGGDVIAFNASYVDVASGALLGRTIADGKQIAADIASKTVDRDHLYYADGRFGVGDITGVTGLTWAAQGAPRLVQAEKNVADSAAALENVQPDIAKQLQPRLAAGIKVDGALLLVLVDGRGNADRGLYLSELATVMLHYGARDAINLDGGGSATLFASFPELRTAIDIKKGNYHLADLSASSPRTVHHAVVVEVDKAKLLPPALFGIDCAVPLTAAKAKALAAEGVKFAVRYLVPASYAWKRLLKSEADAIQTAGLRLASVFQLGEDRPKGGGANGKADGKAALAEAKSIGQPEGSAIFMAVDYDAPENDYDKIEAYLRAAQAELPGYHVGVYGHYSVIEEMARRSACRYFWQTYAWSGGRKSSRADLWQYKNNVTMAGHTVDYNECYDDSIFWGAAFREEEKPVNEIAIIVNDKEMPEKGEVKAGVTRVPVRVIAEALGAKVIWDKEANAVRITI
ncbi:DUF1906 domain-containing protein [Cohnella sp. LGH]|uniref:glycoside hydrolase domain-containing protein n=1 Tax=Cohnella sp. LGH TaxID=1619153 RepID=UPI001AD9AC6A|nr:glycoside hydrolase domain-containing protein [Cohnella sp. LGH]QTH44978.1 DUF1906 domain-containing protein [Cohnella sp. LGH]